MPRPCQRRREQTAAQQKRKSNNNPKPAGPPPIRHKAKQKAIHNARHGRGGRGGARGGGAVRGGRQSKNQRSGLGYQLEQERDFISFSERGNNFQVLDGHGDRSGGRFDPITFDDTDDEELEDGELMTDNGTEEESSEDLDTRDMMINVQVDQSHNRHTKGFAFGSARPRRAEVMFPIVQAISIYRTLYDAGFPLHKARMDRFGVDKRVVLGGQTQTVIRSGSDSEGLAQYEAITFKMDTSGDVSLGRGNKDTGRDYIFDFGVHAGKGFADVPESYLKTIGGNPLLLDKHPGIKEAFDFHRPGMRRTEPTQAQLAAQEKVQKEIAAKAAAGPKTRSKSKTTFFDSTSNSSGRALTPNALVSRPNPPPSAPLAPSGALSAPKSSKKRKTWEDFTFPANSAHAKKRLDQVDENYLKTLEGMAHVMRKWPGLKEALRDYNEKTGRAGRGVK